MMAVHHSGGHHFPAYVDDHTVVDRATYRDPIQFSEGIEYVIVNGEVPVDGGEHTGVRVGRVLRHRAVHSAYPTS